MVKQRKPKTKKKNITFRFRNADIAGKYEIFQWGKEE
jgi:hypothetical protein